MTKLADVAVATAIRPFQVNTPEAELTELRRRIIATDSRRRKPSPIRRRACNLPSFKRSRGIGRPTTTGGGVRRN